ncbi:MAG TPA: histidine kinase [Thermoanaerobaculia bacterium]|nr:histidine kinase [Thermoanaerobaculia bacterium]
MSRRLWVFAASFWALFGIVSGVQVWISMITHGHSMALLVAYHVAVWEGWLLPVGGILWLSRRFPVIPPRRMNVLLHFLVATGIAVLHGFYWMVLLVVMKPYDRMTAEASQLEVARLLFARLPLEWVLYCLVLGAVIAYDRVVRTAQLERALSEARLHALELQIQPHFLFNTMNAISSLVRSRRNDEAITMLAGLSDLLRYTLDHAEQQRVSLDEELSVLRRYLEIQYTRFPDRMQFVIDAAPETKNAAVPALLLQPLAENAVRHGIDASSGPGVVDVRAFRSGERLRIEIFNSGSVSASARTGIGLRNTRERLKHLYGDAWSFELANANGGVLASVTIPWSTA